MPSVSRSQNRFFHAVLNNPALAKEKGIAQSVAHDFVEADAGRKISQLPEHVPAKPRSGGGRMLSPRQPGSTTKRRTVAARR